MSKTRTVPKFDWTKFEIIRSLSFGDRIVLEVKYEDGWTNWAGRKILVYIGVSSIKELLEKTNGSLDPHFKNFGYPPAARFPPTEQGWMMAGFLSTTYPGAIL